jgi:hypothetical protein
MIVCTRCYRELPRDAYYNSRKSLVCRDCHIARVRARQAKVAAGSPAHPERSCAYCPRCYDLPWRRPKRGLCACGLRYAMEPLPRLDPYSREGEPTYVLGGQSRDMP